MGSDSSLTELLLGARGVPNLIIKFEILCSNTATDDFFFPDTRWWTQHQITKKHRLNRFDHLWQDGAFRLFQHLFPCICTSHLQQSLTCLLSARYFQWYQAWFLPPWFGACWGAKEGELRSPYSDTDNSALAALVSSDLLLESVSLNLLFFQSNVNNFTGDKSPLPFT